MTMQSVMPGPFGFKDSTNSLPVTPTEMAEVMRSKLELIDATSPKYIHRAEGPWATDWVYRYPFINGATFFPGGHWDNLQTFTNLIHNGITTKDYTFQPHPDIILEACLFEQLESGEDAIICTIPKNGDTQYLFDGIPELNNASAFDVNLHDMLYEDTKTLITQIGLASVPKGLLIPDISRWQTRAWFYYRACEFIKRGFESIHMGRMDIMLKRDCDNILIGDLVEKIRAFGKQNARRGVVFLNSVFTEDDRGFECNSYTYNGYSQYDILHKEEYFQKSQVYYAGSPVNKKLLWDWGSAGINMVENLSFSGPNQPGAVTVNDLKNTVIMSKSDPTYLAQGQKTNPPYGLAAGGQHPQGWLCDRLPYYVEFDVWTILPTNTTSSLVPNDYGPVYGMDDRSWFMSMPEQDRKDWLRYAYSRVKCLDKNAFLSMPGYFPTSYKYNSGNRTFEQLPFLANGADYNLVPTINYLWNNFPMNSDKNMFTKVNSRDLHSYPASTFSSTEKTYVGDFNGDGKNDVLVTANASKQAGTIVGNSFDGTKLYISDGNDFQEYDYDFNHPLPGNHYPSWGERIYSGDFDGDGVKNDIAVTANSDLGVSGVVGTKFYKITASASTKTYYYTESGSISFPGANEEIEVGNFNSNSSLPDTKDDLLSYSKVPNAWLGFKITMNSSGAWSDANPYVHTQLIQSVTTNASATNCNSPSWGEKYYVGDFNGDGMRNEFCTIANKAVGVDWQGIKMYSVTLAPGSSLLNTECQGQLPYNNNWTPSWGECIYVGDFNGDLKDDIIATANKSLGTDWQGYRVLTNNYGSGVYGFITKDVAGGNEQCAFPSWGERFSIGDYNGDGASDFVVTANSGLGINWPGWAMYRSNGSTGAFQRTLPTTMRESQALLRSVTQSEAEILPAIHPNPVAMGGTATVSYFLKVGATVSADVLDGVGRTVRMLTAGQVQGVGSHALAVPTLGLSAGLYTVRLVHDGATEYRKLAVE
ncbi:hypothetical protein GCM10027594_01480 [Hymenobacter agri]